MKNIYLMYLASIVGMTYNSSMEKPPAIQSTDSRKTQSTRKHAQYPFGKHENPIRFRGSKIKLYSPSISPDYPFIAKIERSDNNGEDIYLSWVDLSGVKISYLMRPDDEIIVVGLKDSEGVVNGNVKVTVVTEVPVRVVPVRESVTRRDATRRVKPSKLSPMLLLVKELKRQGIGSKRTTDNGEINRVSFLYDKYYIEFNADKYELYGTVRGIMTKFGSVESCVKRIKKLEQSFNAEELLSKLV